MNFQSIFQLVLQGAIAVENTLGATQPHETKRQIVVDSVGAVARSLEQSKDPQVAGIAAVVDVGAQTFELLYESITATLRQTGVITSRGPSPAPAAVAEPSAKVDTGSPVVLKV